MPILVMTDDLNTSKAVNTVIKQFEFNYSASTRTHNLISEANKSRRKKSIAFDCDVKTRANRKKRELQEKFRQQRREKLEKLVAAHHAKKGMRASTS